MKNLLIFVSLIVIAPIASAIELKQTDALRIIESAAAAAQAKQAPGGAIALVDDGGHLIALLRLDNTFPAAAEVATGKARTAAMFRKPTRVLEDIINQGRVSMTTVQSVTGFTPLQGGVPIVRDGEVIGAIGVSGAASAAQDEEIAQAAAQFAAHSTDRAATAEKQP